MTKGNWWRVLFYAGMLGVPRAAAAQPIIILPDHPSISAAVGVSSNGDDGSGHSSTDVSGAYELPIAQPYRLRFAAGRVAWPFDKTSGTRPPRFDDTVSLARATVTLMKVVMPPLVGSPTTAYIGIGMGFYRYGFEQKDLYPVVRSGLHVLGGFEYRLPANRVVLGWEAQLHAVKGPMVQPIPATTVLVLQGSFGVKYRF
jgi:hypothetical protein